MSKSDVKLIMVTDSNNNKFYNMHDNNNGTFTVTWGRVGTSGTQTTYDISDWDSKLNSKLRKGYKDVSALSRQVTDYKPVSDAEIDKLLNTFLANSRQFVSQFTSTNILSPSAQVEVQEHINNLAKNIDIENPDKFTLNAFNKELLLIFNYMPRKMSKVQDHLAQTLSDRSKIVKREQDLLDNIIMLSKTANTSTDATKTIEDAFGFSISKCSQVEIDFIKNKLAEDGFRRYTFNRAFKICTPSREKGFEEYLENNNLANNDTNVKLYWHGTGTENILSIMSTGLLIRPSNASITGKMFGTGIYSAPSVDKAIGYTSVQGSYWKGGSNDIAYVFLNAVITGKSYDVHSNYEKYGNISLYNLDGDKFSSQNLNYHSIYAHSGTALRRDEVIVYNQNQIVCKYLVEFKT